MLTFHLRSGAFPGSSNPDVAVHVPPGFDATRRPGLLVYFHGWRGCVRAAMSDHGVPCRDGGDERPGAAMALELDRARVNAIGVAVELRADMPTGEPGNLASPGGLHELLRELLSEKLPPYLGCSVEVDALDRVVVVAHSGGYRAAANVLERGDVPQIREVVLLDALYGASDVFLRWMSDGADDGDPSVPALRRLIDLYTCCGGTAEASRALARAARAPSHDSGGPSVLRSPSESERELYAAMRARRCGIDEVTLAHDDLPRAYFGLIAETAGFEKLSPP